MNFLPEKSFFFPDKSFSNIYRAEAKLYEADLKSDNALLKRTSTLEVIVLASGILLIPAMQIPLLFVLDSRQSRISKSFSLFSLPNPSLY